MEAIKILIMCVGMACVYGILHDMVTAHVCAEYFTVAHPPLSPWTHPAGLALYWGIVATWWVGVGLWPLLALAARAGGWPKRSAGEMFWPILSLLLALYVVSMLCGLLGYALCSGGWFAAPPPWDVRIAPARHARFMFDAWAHLAAYAFGVLGALSTAAWVLWRRRALARRRDKNLFGDILA